MLEELPTTEDVASVFRYQNLAKDVDALLRMGFDREYIEEMLVFLEEEGTLSHPEEVLDMPFRPKPQLEAGKNYGTRFSDGGIRVFYSSLEPDTAEKEVFFWYAKPAIGDKSKDRTVFYERVECRYEGSTKDLRRKAKEWGFLVQDGDEAYDRCQGLARDAVSSGIDGFFTPTARAPSGTNVPVFSRAALSDAKIDGHISFSIDQSTGDILINRL